MSWENVKIRDTEEARRQMVDLNCSPEGAEIMAPKAVFITVRLRGVKNYVANILKQEMLSLGGEVAVPYGIVDCKKERADLLVFGTLRQYRDLLDAMVDQSKLITCGDIITDLREIVSHYGGELK